MGPVRKLWGVIWW